MTEIVEVEPGEGEPEPVAAAQPSERSNQETPEVDDLLPAEDTPAEDMPLEELTGEEPPEKKPARVRTVRRSGRTKPAKPAAPESTESEQGGAAKEKGAKEQESGDERKAFYGLDFNELDRDLTPEQRQEWNSIYAAYRGHSVMTGTIDFVIIHVDRQAWFAVASRRLALPSRRYYFSTQPDLHKPGSRVECQVLVVGPRRCLVSCYGYDLGLTQRELSYTAVSDLRDVYHTGRTLSCIVKS